MLTDKNEFYLSTHREGEYKYKPFTNELFQLDNLIHCWVPVEFTDVPINVAAYFHNISTRLRS